MSRIRRGYEDRFRALLRRARARRLEQGVQWLVARAWRLSASDGISLADALAQVYEQLVTSKPFQQSASQPAPVLFLCDAGLGGLARWLRAAGYEAAWQPDIADDELLRQARQARATVLTTDGMLMERRLLRDRIIPAFLAAADAADSGATGAGVPRVRPHAPRAALHELRRRVAPRLQGSPARAHPAPDLPLAG